MPSSQINFYMMPEDVAELEQYIKEQGLVIIASRMKTKEPEVTNSLIDNNDLITFVLNPEHKEQLDVHFSEPRNEYFIYVSNSPVIEFFKPIKNTENKTIKNGRLYYNTTCLSKDGKMLASKNKEFIETSANLFKWYKKHFKNVKINSNWTTQRVANFISQDNYILTDLMGFQDGRRNKSTQS